ncbi:MAG: type II toxin-antitoxin system mRNA interferase toxin, RelE/StbE family [Patescibacteria group bacterium]
MYLIKENKKFRKSVKKILRAGKIERADIQNIVEILASGGKLKPKNKDHELKGKFQGIRECHIEYDMLLLYQVDEKNEILILVNVGSHSDLFG